MHEITYVPGKNQPPDTVAVSRHRLNLSLKPGAPVRRRLTPKQVKILQATPGMVVTEPAAAPPVDAAPAVAKPEKPKPDAAERPRKSPRRTGEGE